MIDIDYIMELLDWNKRIEEQEKGTELAKKVKCLDVFIMPKVPYGERVWENCAKIFSGKSDEEIKPYLSGLLKWLKDTDKPGSLIILNRLKKCKKDKNFKFWLEQYLKDAKNLDNTVWERNLIEIQNSVFEDNIEYVKYETNIDYIMSLLSWSKSIEEQEEGIKLARKVNCLNIFMQPGYPYGKEVWGNCAKILAIKSDQELTPYLYELFAWLQDLNWPGALIILERLKNFKDKTELKKILDECIREAEKINDNTWKFWLVDNFCPDKYVEFIQNYYNER